MLSNNFVWDVWTGDMGALMILFLMFLPFILIYALVMWAKDKITNTNKEGNHHDQQRPY